MANINSFLRFCASLSLFAHVVLCDQPNYSNYEEYASLGPAPMQQFKSDNINAPIWNIDIWNESAIDLESPYMFFSLGDGSSNGPYIFDSRDLSLVYGDRSWNASNNARMQTYRDEMYMTFWEGDAGKGHAEGTCHMLDHQYKEVAKFNTKNMGAQTDLHECRITEWGTVLVTVYVSTPYNLTEVGGPADGLMKDSCFQELDIETGEVLFEWHASDHIPYTESYSEYEWAAPGWDPYHINTLQKDEEGNYYVSLRRIHALVKINGKDGSRMWQLGGKMNNFTDLSDGHATDFAWQHHTQLYNNFTLLTMFDNRNLHGEREVNCIGDVCSKGSRIELDYENMTARLLQNFYSPTGLMAYAMGSYDTLPNNNVLIGWGGAEISEFSSDGIPVMNIHFGQMGSWRRTYRVYKSHWVGKPTWPPGIGLEVSPTKSTVYASWNGATEVTHWVIASADNMQDLMDLTPHTARAHFQKKGFETAMPWDGKVRFVRVAALDKDGNVIGATKIADIKAPDIPIKATEPPSDVRYDMRNRVFINPSKPDSLSSTAPQKVGNSSRHAP